MKRPAAESTAGIPGVHLPPGALTPYGWRFGRHLTRSRTDVLLRSRLLRRVTRGWRHRFLTMGLPPDVVEATLAEVRTLAGWAEAWTATAQRFLGEARRAEREDDLAGGAASRQRAALCYHVAGWFAFEDQRLARTCHASSVSLFAQSIAQTMPRTRKVLVPWRTTMLPGYLATPKGTGPFPLVVLLNGITTVKEELILWRGAFLRQGLAVLALDTPGTGEMADGSLPDPRDDDFTAGLFDLATHDRDLDADRVVLVGFSLGGAIAIRAAAYHHRIAGVVAVTPPFAPGEWFDRALPLLRDQVFLPVADGIGDDVAELYDLAPVVPRLRCPLLVFGGGRDLIVPPTEAVRLAAAGGDGATLVWYPRGTHGLYDVLDAWTTDAARWIAAVTGSVAVAADASATTATPPPGTIDPIADRPISLDGDDERVAEIAHAAEWSESDGGKELEKTGPMGEGSVPGPVQPIADARRNGPSPVDRDAGPDADHEMDLWGSLTRDGERGRGDVTGTPSPPVPTIDGEGEDRVIDAHAVAPRDASGPADRTAEHPLPRPEDFA